ncbi:Putative pentatricopeptide repeat-containing protein [Striga hermonthica]|uniref:Pentatricopeptide repeat-containing protein n=1 Tax=Striga hermonthica TaxID=68872 RepID=A0A9N7RKW5_STRHE|nr:Putative pentatricopeptide repeat-containing protein [Striga hermonthica]
MSPRKINPIIRTIPTNKTSYFSHRLLNSGRRALSTSPFSAKPPSVLATDVIKSYFQAGLVNEARKLFDEMPERDVVVWSAVIGGYASCNLHTHAWLMFRDMLRDDGAGEVSPNEFTFSSVLKACKGMGSLSCGASAHGLAVRHGVLGSIYVANTLLDMYAACCCCMGPARAVFEEIEVKNSVSWTALITGYTHMGDGHGGLKVFRQMLVEETELNPFNISIAIRACASVGSQAYGQQIHATVLKSGFESSIPIMNSILDMYFRCVGPPDATRCFRGMKERDIITWNTMIAGHEKPDPHSALTLYSTLVALGTPSPNCFTLTSAIAAAASLAALRAGQQVHGGAIRRGLTFDLGVANSLIDMYAKCGSISGSCAVFEGMREKNVVTWTSMMIGHGSHGQGREAVELFRKMVQAGVQPDRIVFVAVINACSHAGLVDEGLWLFESMWRDYGVAPDLEVYGCVVDLLGRAGRVGEAYGLIEAMPFAADESVWGALLGACRAHKVTEMGKLAAGRVLGVGPGGYLALSGIYAAEGRWGDFARVRRIMRGIGRKKEAGRSWVEVAGKVWSFVAGDKLGPQVEWVYETVDVLASHVMETGCVRNGLWELECDWEDGT